MNELRDRLVAAMTAPSRRAVVTVATGWRATRLAYAAGWAARRKAGWRPAVPTARAVVFTVGGACVFAGCAVWVSELAVVRALPLGSIGWAVAAFMVLVGLSTFVLVAAVLGWTGGSTTLPVRFVAAGDDTETVQVRVGSDFLVVEGWAYLDQRRAGCPPRPCVAARRVLDFAAAERVPVFAAVSTSAVSLRERYADLGFVTVSPRRVPWVVRLPHLLGARVTTLVRPVSRAALGR